MVRLTGISSVLVLYLLGALLRVHAFENPFPGTPPTSGYTFLPALSDLSWSGQPVGLRTDAGRLFVWTREGRVWVVTNTLVPTRTLFLQLPNVWDVGDAGMPGFALHPAGGFAFTFANETNTATGTMVMRLRRWTLRPNDPNRALPESEVLLEQIDRDNGHTGGSLQFGPDGYLYVSLGDEGKQQCQFLTCQRIDEDFFSAVMRIDVDGRPGNLEPNPHPAIRGKYWIPSDNPFVGATSFNSSPVDPSRVRTEFWAVGVRNPHSMSFDSDGQLYLADVGENRWEEVNRIERGGNYGWHWMEGPEVTDFLEAPAVGDRPPVEFKGPLWAYKHPGIAGPGDDTRFLGNAVMGGFVYRGPDYPSLYGKYLCSDHTSRNVWAVNPQNGTVEWLGAHPTGANAWCVDPQTGEILVASFSGATVMKMVPTSDLHPIPGTLSETGAFADLRTLTPAEGVVPYDVASPFWSDFAIKKRWIILPPGAQVTRGDGEFWSFPPGTVWVKHFDLPTSPDGTQRLRLETRFLVKTIDGSYGLTYRWREDQSDADLVPEEGANTSLLVDHGDGPGFQPWHFPARSECTTCHNRAAGWILGFSTRQLNVNLPTGDGSSVNQLQVLSQLGIFADPFASVDGLPRLSRPEDESISLEHRFKSFTDANCSNCHRPGGDGRGEWDARLSTPLADSGILKGEVVRDLGRPGSALITPGSTDLSVLWRRVADFTSPQHPAEYHMPPLATYQRNEAAVDLIRRFIESREPRTQWEVERPGTVSGPSGSGNDAPPGRVTRLPSDPDFLGAGNPEADDDFYFSGTYPAGFNGLTAPLVVPNDEPPSALDRILQTTDPTNRIHFNLSEVRLSPGLAFRLSLDLSQGGIGSPTAGNSGFGAHRLVIRFRNQSGEATVVHSEVITQPTRMVFEFPASEVHPSPGANTIEVVRADEDPVGDGGWIASTRFRLEAVYSPNSPPTAEAPADQVVEELSTLYLRLTGQDLDLPIQTLRYSLVSGPSGMEVTPEGELYWTPASAQCPGMYPVTIRVKDDGVPPLWVDRRFTVIAYKTSQASRSVWQIGIDDNPSVAPYDPTREFSIENQRNDPAPGLVTRQPGDPQYNSATNPGADDDFYFSGAYPRGFNGLPALLLVPNDEPSRAWERANSSKDMTNRLHFVLGPDQAAVEARFRLSFELLQGGWFGSGISQPGFSRHDLVVRFRNGFGRSTVLFSKTLTQAETVKLEFTADEVAATPGANSIEVVRTGPNSSNYSYWIKCDYLRLESLAAGNSPPLLVQPSDLRVNESTPVHLQLAASDSQTPAASLQFGLVEGPQGLSVSEDGVLDWVPTEAQGPGVFPVVVFVRDLGTPPMTATTRFWIAVEEVNAPPIPVDPGPVSVDELSTLTLDLSATDSDLPAETLTYEKVSGPPGLTVTPGGTLLWTPTEDQGPGTHPVVVSVTDGGTPPASVELHLALRVNERNTAPVLAPVADLAVDELTPLAVALSAEDSDRPLQPLTFERMDGPEGLTVSADGRVNWTPSEEQGPGIYPVTVRVRDGGVPEGFDTKTFSVTVNDVADPEIRNVWQIGTRDNPGVQPYVPSGEFSIENRHNDPAPGKVTRLAEDPQYSVQDNPGADDDFYTAGTYPAGFNGLATSLLVPNDEPAAAWERAHTHKDLTNRMHFVVDPSQVQAGTTFRLTLAFSSGGLAVNNVTQRGFSDHDMEVRVRNGSGVATRLFSQRVSGKKTLSIAFPGTTMTPGANTIEIVRRGPVANGYSSYWIQYDFLRLETEPILNAPPALAGIPDAVTEELQPFEVNLSAVDADGPAQALTYELVEGPEGLVVTAGGRLDWTPTEEQGPGIYPVTVRVRDHGTPEGVDTTTFSVTVTEVNTAPVLNPIADQKVEPQTSWSVLLTALDADLPAQSLSFEKVDGPAEATVSETGRLDWTPTGASLPGVYRVVVRVWDHGAPELSDTRSFSVAVGTPNSAPVPTPVGTQYAIEQIPFALQLEAADGEDPAGALVYSLADGWETPAGLTVTPGGLLRWTPDETQGGRTYSVGVRVTDGGVPALEATNVVMIVVEEVPQLGRTAWQIGTDSPPGATDVLPHAEFSPPNGRNDLRPGQVTRLPEDPEFAGVESNPTADDDFYFAGIYPIGFNQLPEILRVPNDEPATAWERSHTLSDKTNRVHFLLGSAHATPDTTFRLTIDLPGGGWMANGVVQSGFSEHDFVVRFRNGAGVATPVYSSRLTRATILVLDFTAGQVAATPGGNSLELVRTGPSKPGVGYWITYDHVRLEVLAPNEPPQVAPVGTLYADEGAPLHYRLTAADPGDPLSSFFFSLVSGPQGLTVSSDGILEWTPTETQGDTTNSVVVAVTDTGIPPLSATEEFSVVVADVPQLDRSIWQLGVDSPPNTPGEVPWGEFSIQNQTDDASPGQVSRLPGDPVYDADPASNPGPDDDFYFGGVYPQGFNLLPAVLRVPNDEPFWAWERAHTQGDRTNRMHFVLGSSLVSPSAAFQLTVDLPSATWIVNDVPQPGFGDHDFVVAFLNGAGVRTVLHSDRLSAATNLVLQFSASQVAATFGANTIELIRTGPNDPTAMYWIVYDHVRLEAIASETAPKAGLSARRARVLPAAESREAAVTYGSVRVRGRSHLTVTYTLSDPPPNGLDYLVESSSDLVHWVAEETVPVSNTVAGGRRTVTVRDARALGDGPARFLRLQIRPVADSSAGGAY